MPADLPLPKRTHRRPVRHPRPAALPGEGTASAPGRERRPTFTPNRERRPAVPPATERRPTAPRPDGERRPVVPPARGRRPALPPDRRSATHTGRRRSGPASKLGFAPPPTTGGRAGRPPRRGRPAR
jgi:hypothetical protein